MVKKQALSVAAVEVVGPTVIQSAPATHEVVVVGASST